VFIITRKKKYQNKKITNFHLKQYPFNYNNFLKYKPVPGIPKLINFLPSAVTPTLNNPKILILVPTPLLETVVFTGPVLNTFLNIQDITTNFYF
jgi:hypothetical protein